MCNAHYKAARGLSLEPQELRQLGDVGNDAPGLIAGERLGCRIAHGDVGHIPKLQVKLSSAKLAKLVSLTLRGIMRSQFSALLIKARTHPAFSVIHKAWLFVRAIVSASAANGGWYRAIEPGSDQLGR